MHILIARNFLGEMNVMYLFVRYKFKWNEIDYSIFATFGFVVHIIGKFRLIFCNFFAFFFAFYCYKFLIYSYFFTIGTIFSLVFFSKFLKLDDTVLGAISSISKILSGFIYAYAPTPTIFYLGENLLNSSTLKTINLFPLFFFLFNT